MSIRTLTIAAIYLVRLHHLPCPQITQGERINVLQACWHRPGFPARKINVQGRGFAFAAMLSFFGCCFKQNANAIFATNAKCRPVPILDATGVFMKN